MPSQTSTSRPAPIAPPGGAGEQVPAAGAVLGAGQPAGVRRAAGGDDHHLGVAGQHVRRLGEGGGADLGAEPRQGAVRRMRTSLSLPGNVGFHAAPS